MSEAKVDAGRIIGNDGVLCAALEQGLCDSVVSGVACVLPELILRIFVEDSSGDAFARDRVLLDEFVAQLGSLPTPWA